MAQIVDHRVITGGETLRWEVSVQLPDGANGHRVEVLHLHSSVHYERVIATDWEPALIDGANPSDFVLLDTLPGAPRVHAHRELLPTHSLGWRAYWYLMLPIVFIGHMGIGVWASLALSGG